MKIINLKQLYLFSLAFPLIFLCTNRKIVRESYVSSDTLITRVDTLSSEQKKISPDVPTWVSSLDSTHDSTKNKVNSIPVLHWVGKKFRLLEKTKMFQKFGYELYTTPQLSKTTEKVNADIALSNSRIKYEPFKGKTIIAKQVNQRDDGEYLISFFIEDTDLTVYGKTSSGIIEGLVLFEDFFSAEKRWKGTTIYSRRRSVEIFDSAASRFSAERVSITEPLKVIAIRWGITPLPPKSLWLVVEGKDNLKGIIPINYSWTNVLRDGKVQGAPWENDIFENDPRKMYQWDDYVWHTIDKHNVFTGMTTAQVKVSWGEPDKIMEEAGNGTKMVKYIYQGKTLLFEHDTLISANE